MRLKDWEQDQKARLVAPEIGVDHLVRKVELEQRKEEPEPLNLHPYNQKVVLEDVLSPTKDRMFLPLEVL